jgi:hypothetical protein
MECRSACGACCIAPSITSPLPGMPGGKPAGVPCINLEMENYLCKLWGTDLYPQLCRDFKPCESVCGQSRQEAIQLISLLELTTG